MTDTLGLLQLPALATDDPVGDPLRKILGQFLAAHLNAKLKNAWNELCPGNVVERIETNDPADNTFVASKLPCLAVYDANRPQQFEQLSDDIELRRSQIAILWVPPPVPQGHRAKREAFSKAVTAAIFNALRRGRTPTWKYTGDTDPLTATRGSYINNILHLFQPIHLGATAEDAVLQIEMRGDPQGPPAKYPATRVLVNVVEEHTEGLEGVVDNAGAGTWRTNGDATTDFEQTYPVPE